jgi:hypothetical protein
MQEAVIGPILIARIAQYQVYMPDLLETIPKSDQ